MTADRFKPASTISNYRSFSYDANTFSQLSEEYRGIPLVAAAPQPGFITALVFSTRVCVIDADVEKTDAI